MKFDMHCHTKAGSIDARTPLSRYIDLLQIQGFDGMLVTDHDSYKGYRQWKEENGSADNFTVLEGVEYDTRDGGHILVIMPDGVELDVLQVRGLKLSTLIDLVHHFGGILGPSHPFGTKSSSLMHCKAIKRNPGLLRKFDFLEGFNTCESAASNYLAQGLAVLWDKPCTGGSDSHSDDCVGRAWTEFTVDIHSNNDLIEAIRQNKIEDFGGQVRGDLFRRRVKESFCGVWAFRAYNRGLGMLFAWKRHRRINKLPFPFGAAAE